MLVILIQYNHTALFFFYLTPFVRNVLGLTKCIKKRGLTKSIKMIYPLYVLSDLLLNIELSTKISTASCTVFLAHRYIFPTVAAGLYRFYHSPFTPRTALGFGSYFAYWTHVHKIASLHKT